MKGLLHLVRDIIPLVIMEPEGDYSYHLANTFSLAEMARSYPRLIFGGRGIGDELSIHHC